MVPNRKIIPLILFLTLVLVALLVMKFRSPPAPAWETKSDSQGEVTIEVTPLVLKAGEKPKFDIAFNTHVVELDFKVEEIASLTNEKGIIDKNSQWIGPEPGGHHRAGTLTFTKPLEGSGKVTLTLASIAGVTREFIWIVP